LIIHISGTDRDIDKQKTAFSTAIYSTFVCKQFGELVYTNNKVLLSYFEPPKFNTALAIHVYDNAIAFGPRDFAVNGILTP